MQNNNIEIIASGTIIIEPKIIREGKNVGHIEDIVVAKHMRGKDISSKIINILKLFARFLSEWKSVKTWIKLFKKPHKTNNNNNI